MEHIDTPEHYPRSNINIQVGLLRRSIGMMMIDRWVSRMSPIQMQPSPINPNLTEGREEGGRKTLWHSNHNVSTTLVFAISLPSTRAFGPPLHFCASLICSITPFPFHLPTSRPIRLLTYKPAFHPAAAVVADTLPVRQVLQVHHRHPNPAVAAEAFDYHKAA